MTDIAMNIVIQATDQASNIIEKIGSAFGPVGSAIAVAGAALVGFGAASVQVAAQYQRSMNMVQSLTGASAQQMQQYDQGLKQLASDTGVSATKLTDSLYFMTSAGYTGADAMKMLTLSTKDSVIGQTSAAVTANSLATVMRGFSIDISHADQVNGEMLRTVTAGKMTFQDYASAISKTSSVAVQYHDTMEDMNAVLATLTANGIKNANVAGTDYNNLLKVLNGNTKSVAINAHALNSAFDETKFASMSVADKVNYLNTMIVQHGHNITDVIGKQQNAAAAFTVLSQHAGMYAANLKNLSDQQANADATQKAWQITQAGFQVSISRLQASFQNFMIDLGNAFLPVLTQVVNWVSNAVDAFVTWEEKTHFIENAMTSLGNALGPVWQAIQNIGAALGNVWQAISPIFDGLSGAAQGWGQNLMAGFIDGIGSMLSVLTDMLNSVATEISNFLGFASPSKKGPGQNLMKWGPAMILSFAEGIKSSSPLVADAIGDITQYFDRLNGNATAGGSSLAANAAQSFVSIGSALQTVTLGQPFGASGTAGSTGTGSTTSAIAKNVNALGTNTATVAKTTAQTAKQAAAQIKSQQSAQAATANLDATLQKALGASNTSDVQALVDKARSAQSGGNMAMAKFYASQALQLADKDKAAADKAAKTAKGKAGKGGAGGGGFSVPNVDENGILGQFQKKMDALKPPTIKPKLELPDVGKNMSDAIRKGAGTVEKTFKEVMGGGFIKSVKEALSGAAPGFAMLGQALAGLLPVAKQVVMIAGQTMLNIFKAAKPVIEAAIPPIIKLAGGIADGLGKAIKFLSPYITEAAKAIGQFATDIADRVAPIVKKWFDQLNVGLDFIKAHWSQIWGAIGPILKITWDQIVGVIKIAWAIVSGIIKIGLDLMSGNWKQAWTDMSDMVSGIWDGLKTMFGDVIQQLILSFKPMFQLLAQIPGPWQDMAKGVLKSMDTMAAGTKEKTADMKNQAAANTNAMKLSVLANTAQMHGAAITELSKMAAGVQTQIANTTDPVKKHMLEMKLASIQHAIDMHKQVLDEVKKQATDIQNKTNDMKNSVSQSTLDMKDKSFQHFQQMRLDAIDQTDKMKTTITQLMNDTSTPVQSIALGAAKGVVTSFTTMQKQAVSQAQAMHDHTSQQMRQMNNEVVGHSIVPDMVTNIGLEFAKLPGLATKWVGDMMTQFINGINNKISAVTQAVQGVASTIASYLHFSTPDIGPLANSDKWMPDMMAQLASGMTSNLGQVQKSAQAVAQSIGYIHTAAGVALPDYSAGTGQSIADVQPVAAASSSGALAKELHIHVHLGDSDGDADKHAKKVAQSVKKELAKMTRSQAITPRYTSGGTR